MIRRKLKKKRGTKGHYARSYIKINNKLFPNYNIL